MSDWTKPLVSVVVPLLNEEENIPALLDRFDEVVAANPDYGFEFVVVDDGSTDGTLEQLRKGCLDREEVVIVVLSRNFGSHYAISAGLAEASGADVLVLGGDLQEPVDLVARLLERRRAGCDVVWAVREQRANTSRVARWLSALFTRLLTRYSDLGSYPADGPSRFACSGDVADIVTKLPERNRNVLGLVAWVGFVQCTISFQIGSRQAGTSKWGTARKVKMAIDSFVEFSFAPIRFMSYAGLVVALLGFAYAVVLTIRKLFFDVPFVGWTTVVVVILVLGGFQLMVLGVLGEYLWRTADESRRRPLYIVKETVRTEGDAAEAGAHVDPAHKLPIQRS